MQRLLEGVAGRGDVRDQPRRRRAAKPSAAMPASIIDRLPASGTAETETLSSSAPMLSVLPTSWKLSVSGPLKAVVVRL